MILPPPPPRNGRRHPAFFDTESYPNYWLLRFRPMGGQTFSFQLGTGMRFTSEQIEQMLALFDSYLCVGFFSKGYDQWTIARALGGGAAEEMWETTRQLIGERIKGWNLPGLNRWEPRDHVDIIEVCPGGGSQKQYAGRVHAKTMRDLPYPPGTILTTEQMVNVFEYCGNDLAVLEHLYHECEPLLEMREKLTERYGMDLRSKSDAQLAEAVLKRRCEEALGTRIWKEENWQTQQIRFRVPEFVAYSTPELQHALNLIRNAVFETSPSTGAVLTPPELEKLVINLGRSSYQIGIGGLHSQEKCISYRSDEHMVIRDNDVASYYPSLILNSGEFPTALGPTFRSEYQALIAERLAAKKLQGQLKAAGDTSSPEYQAAKVMNEGGKIMINGTFGKTGSIYSILYAPTMMLQTTLSGQLSLLMLIEWHELYGIPVISANTDGVVIACPRHLVPTSEALIKEWEKRTSLTMETVEYKALHSRDVNSYFAIKSDGSVKRKGEYAQASFVDKKNPDVEVCSDAVAEFLSKGTPIELSIRMCRDVRKFVTMQKVDGGAYKMWGEGPTGEEKVAEMIPRIQAHGFTKGGNRRWIVDPLVGAEVDATTAYAMTFPMQRLEYLGKVVRWYYSTNAPGHIVYGQRKAKVSLSYGAKPCMTLPDSLPTDVDYAWYVRKAHSMLEDVGYRS